MTSARTAPVLHRAFTAFAVRCLLATCVTLLLSACAAETSQSRPRVPAELTEADYPGELRPPSTFPADVLLRQRVTATWGDGSSRGFDGAFQKQGDKLTLLGLSPLGSAGFVVTLDGDRIAFENRTEQDMPFPPRFILLDVQRVFFPWLAPAGGSLADGTHEGDRGDEHLVEVWQDGALVERRFTRLDGHPAGTITVRCVRGQPGRIVPEHATLENGWAGYRLAVDTLEETRLDPAAP